MLSLSSKYLVKEGREDGRKERRKNEGKEGGRKEGKRELERAKSLTVRQRPYSPKQKVVKETLYLFQCVSLEAIFSCLP